MRQTVSVCVCERERDSRPTGDRGEGNSEEVLVLGQSQAVLDSLLQVVHRIVVSPGGTMNMDHMLAW